MYLGRLANGSGDRPPRDPWGGVRERLAACRTKNALAYDWTVAKLGMPALAGTSGIWGKYSPIQYGQTPPASLWTECANGYPMYMQFQFQEAARKLIPTAQEAAEAFVEEIKTIAPTVPVEMPTVVTPPDSRLAPPPPLRMTIPTGEVPPLMVTTPVDSIPGAAFPLMQRYQQQVPVADESLITQYHAPPPEGAAPPEEKKGAGIGTVLALGIPLVLAMAG